MGRETLQSDMAKLVLQRGNMVSAVKHEKPKILDNRCSFYITTNEVPYFGNDEENVQRRIRVFKTKSLESCLTNVDRWIRDNPMDCIVWIVQEIEDNIELVDVNERWYEGNPPVGNDVAVTERGIFTGVDLANAAESVIFDIEKVKSIAKEEIHQELVSCNQNVFINPQEQILRPIAASEKSEVVAVKRTPGLLI